MRVAEVAWLQGGLVGALWSDIATPHRPQLQHTQL